MFIWVLIAAGEVFWSFCSVFGMLIVPFAQYVDVYVYVITDGQFVRMPGFLEFSSVLGVDLV